MPTKREIGIAIARSNNGSRKPKSDNGQKQLLATSNRKIKSTSKKRAVDVDLQLHESETVKRLHKRPKLDTPKEKHLNPFECDKIKQSNSNERKLINEWIQGASHNIDVNEIFQDANFNLSDIEDDAFQLAKYLECSEQTIPSSLNINSTNPTSLNVHQTMQEEKLLGCSVNLWNATIGTEINFERRNDLSKKQSIPIRIFETDLSTLNVSSALSQENVINSNSKIDENGNENFEEKNIICGEIYSEHDQSNTLLVSEMDKNPMEFSENHSTDVSQISLLSKQNFTSDDTIIILDELDEPDETLNGMELKMPNHQRFSAFSKPTQTTSNTKIQTTANIRHDSKLLTTSAAAGNIGSYDTEKYAGAYATITRKNGLKNQMANLFNRPCYNYLNGKHCGKYMCKWKHYLPTTHDVFQKMMKLSNDTVMYMYYNFIMKTKKGFATYFPTICDIFGNKKMEKSLLNAIKHCEQLDEIPFIKCIYNGLVLTGLSKSEALTTIANCSTKGRAINDVILEIIIETDPLYLIDMLEKYYRYATITSQHLMKLIQQVIVTPAPMLNVFIDILEQYSMYHVSDVETFKSVLFTVKNLVNGDINMTQRLNNLASRVP